MLNVSDVHGGRRGGRPMSFGGAPAQGYAGDVPSDEAYDLMKSNPRAVLVDVRSAAEWTFVGLPDLTALGRETVLVEWQSFPGMAHNPHFVDTVKNALAERGVTQSDPVFFLCRSGARSRAAAMAMTQAGFAACYNVSDGFEGTLDEARHRGARNGWKAAGLPWIQG